MVKSRAEKDHRYNVSDKGRARSRRYIRNRRAQQAMAYLRVNRSFDSKSDGRSRAEKLRAMAEQTGSPVEAAIARKKLERYDS